MDPSVAEMLHLLGAGSGGEILMALGPRSLRTQQLTERISNFSARSVYRQTKQMEKYELIDRYEELGVPSTVILSLSRPAGRELYSLLHAFAATTEAHLPGEGSDVKSWSSLKLLGELWKYGFLEELSRGSRSLTQLASGSRHEMTFHQVNRRTRLFMDSGLISIANPESPRKLYELTDHGRRHMALIAGIGRWRRHHVEEASGLTIAEMATVLRTVLPLVAFPQHVGMSLELGVVSVKDEYGRRNTEMLQGTVGVDGTMHFEQEARESVDGSAAATVHTWFAALLDGNRGRMQVRGDLPLVDAFLTQLHQRLWERPKAAPAKHPLQAAPT